MEPLFCFTKTPRQAWGSGKLIALHQYLFLLQLLPFCMAYEEMTGGVSTAALKPSDIVGLIVKYHQPAGTAHLSVSSCFSTSEAVRVQKLSALLMA